MRTTRITNVLGNHKSAPICQRLLEQDYGLFDRVPLVLNLNLTSYLLKTDFRDPRGLGPRLQQCHIQATERDSSVYTVLTTWFEATRIDHDGAKGLHSEHSCTINAYSEAYCVINPGFKAATLITIHPDTAEILIWMPKELLPQEETQRDPDEPPRIRPLGSRDVSATGSVDDLPR